MKEEFTLYLKNKTLCTVSDKILLAVSGGIDSMVMLHLFCEYGFNVSVAHANFQLRGNESDEDEQFVKNYCSDFSISFFCKRFNTVEYAEANSLSIQMAARELRYQWFEELISNNAFDFLATGHHLNDSIETTILNFVRGSGIEGLDGISPKNGKFIRPLLFATRSQIESYASQTKIRWREDRSNSTDDYQRNFIRHKIIPLLRELNPSLENSFNDSIGKIAGANELRELGLQLWKEKFEEKKNERIQISKNAIVQSQNPEGLLWNLIKTFGFNFDQCRQTVRSLSQQPGKKFFSRQYELVTDREGLIISEIQTSLQEVLIEKGQVEAHFGNHVLKIIEIKTTELKNNKGVALLNLSKIAFPLRWRKWQPGDYFYPLGLNHRKKLSDFLIDQKVSVADKEKTTVLESGGQIVWVVGHRIDERFKIIDTDDTAIRIELSTPS